MLEESFKTIRNGEVVEGTVIDVKPDEIVLNIGYKSDGIITRNEYTNEANVDLTTLVSVGDTMEAKVLKVNDGEGQVLLTYKRLAAEKGSKRLVHGYRRSVSRPCRASWKQERKNQCKEHSDASFSHMIHPIALKFSLFTSKSIFSFTWNTVPFKSLVTEMVPPCISTIFFTMASPKPVPPVAVDRDCSTR